MRLKPCIDCGVLSPHSRCPAHNRSGWAAWRAARGSEYGSEWTKVRKQVLLEEPRCRYCGAPSTEVDHILNRAQGGSHARSNLQGLCSHCHKRKTHGESQVSHA